MNILPVKNFRNIIAILLLSFTWEAFSQSDIQREVRVVKPYNPTLSDAEKINLLPDMRDTTRAIPDYNYSITPKHFPASYQVEQIKPAKMLGLPLEKLYKSQLTLGMGNYLSPLGELTINQLRSRNSSMGLFLRHHSSGGKVMLNNDERVFAGFSDNKLNFSGKKFLRSAVMEGKLNADYNRYHYYGYNTRLGDTTLVKDSIRAEIISLGSGFNYYSSHNDSSRLSYKAMLDYNFTSDAFSNYEHGIKASGKFGKLFGDQYAGLFVGINHYQTSNSIDSSNNTIIRINPSIGKKSGEWKFSIGINTSLDIYGDNPELKIYPRASFEFHIVKDVLIPFMGIDGYRLENNYREILLENPFVLPGLQVDNSNYNLIAFGGLKGRYSSKIAYNLSASYTLAEHMHFFANDTSNALLNQFTVQYDDARISSLNAEISYNQSEKIKLILAGHLQSYELSMLSHPWHKPLTEVSLGVSYNMQDKFLIDTDIFFTGKRYASPVSTQAEPISLNAYPDANLSIEYRYTKVISFFLRFNNFTASRYEIWNQYPAQRFQITGGFTYAL